MKKKRLKTFTTMRKVLKVSLKYRIEPLEVYQNLFRQMSIIMQNRNIHLKEVLQYPLGPLHWALPCVIGELKKRIRLQYCIS